MDRFYQAFASSTFEDLKDERSQVSNALAKAVYVAAGMELFPASDQQQLEYIKRIIDRSDYYVVIVAGRYGSLADNKLSHTENEFDYARSQGIPVLAFLPADPAAISAGKTDTDATKKEKQPESIAKVSIARRPRLLATDQSPCERPPAPVCIPKGAGVTSPPSPPHVLVMELVGKLGELLMMQHTGVRASARRMTRGRLVIIITRRRRRTRRCRCTRCRRCCGRRRRRQRRDRCWRQRTGCGRECIRNGRAIRVIRAAVERDVVAGDIRGVGMEAVRRGLDQRRVVSLEALDHRR